jgi:hypothetical protein
MRETGVYKGRRLRADGFIIRAQATIRTDGFTVRADFAKTCALRAPTVFSVRIKGIRTENTVMVKGKDSTGSYPGIRFPHLERDS